MISAQTNTSQWCVARMRDVVVKWNVTMLSCKVSNNLLIKSLGFTNGLGLCLGICDSIPSSSSYLRFYKLLYCNQLIFCTLLVRWFVSVRWHTFPDSFLYLDFIWIPFLRSVFISLIFLSPLSRLIFAELPFIQDPDAPSSSSALLLPWLISFHPWGSSCCLEQVTMGIVFDASRDSLSVSL